MEQYFKNSHLGQITSGKKKIIFNAGFEASLEYAEPNSNTAPEISLLFSPFGLPFVPIEVVGTNANKIISNLQWTKDRNNPGGVLQVTINPDDRIIKEIVAIIDKYSNNLYSKIWGKLGVELEDLFKPMTLCQLWIDGYHVMTGYVRGSSRTSSVSNDDKELSYTIIIEELGNLYNLSTTSLDLILLDGMQTQIADSMKKALSLSATLKGITISEGLLAITNAFKLTTLSENVTLSDGFPLALRLIALNHPLGAIANFSLANFMNLDSSMYQLNSSGSSQSVWSFMQSFVPNPWMEFFTESGGRTMVTNGGAFTGGSVIPSVMAPGFNYVVARTVPYSNPMIGFVNPVYLPQTALFDLTFIHMLLGGDFVIITDDMIQEKTLGVDSVNQSTAFRTSYNNKGVSGVPDFSSVSIKSPGPLNPLASGGIPSFGIREMNQTIDCSSLVGLGAAASVVERIAKNIAGIPRSVLSKNHLSNLLCTWFRNQSRFREGTITTKMIPYARAGMYCLYLPSLSGKKVENIRDIGLYYIDSIDHSYSIDNEDMSATTTLNLIRGVPLPISVAQTALLLFDFEILPPATGFADGEYRTVATARKASAVL